MANNHTTLTSLFVDIADAIRAKKNSTESIVADTFPMEIANLRTGFDYNNHNATSIADYEFYNCADLNNVNCYSLTSIGSSAFEGCENLKTAILYDGVTSVGANAFKGCSDVIIYCEVNEKPDTWDDNWNPDGCEVVWGFEPVETWDISETEEDSVVAKLYNGVHNEGMYLLVIDGSGNMKDFATKNGYTTTINRPWDGLQIRAVIVCDGIANLGSYAFRDYSGFTGLTSVTIPNSVTSIGDYAFSDCESLTSITIPNSVTSIGYYAFSDCSMTSVTIPNSVITIGDSAFYHCSYLTSITIQDSVASTSIGNCAFGDCKNIASVTIPNSVTHIGIGAFSYGESLANITYTGTIAQWNTITFDNNWNRDTGNYTIYCTDGTITKDGTITYYQTPEEVSDNG